MAANSHLTKRRRRKSYIQQGDAALTRYAVNQFTHCDLLADSDDSLPNRLLTDEVMTIPNGLVAADSNALITNYTNAAMDSVKNIDPVLSSLLKNLSVDVSFIRVVKNNFEGSNIPNELLYNEDEESPELCNNRGTTDEANTQCLGRKELFQKFLDGENFYEAIKSTSSITQAELHLMWLKFSLDNHLCHTGVANLSRLVNITTGHEALPQTRYMIDEKFNGIINAEYHALCHKCSLYLGRMEDVVQLSHCENCEAKLNLTNPSSVNYFVMFDSTEFIKSQVEEFQDFYHYVVNERQSDPNTIRDIYDGVCYKNLIEKMSPQERTQYVTVNINTDGAPRFESSNYSVWPIYLMPNEIPMEHRLPIVCGIWFGKHKPDMIPFLWPFVDAFNKLYRDGISCTIRNERLLLILFAACAPVDSIARAPMQGVKQFNGYYGCNWCEQEGTNENGMRYPYIEPSAPKRTAESMQRAMETVVESGMNTCSIGVQSLSPLIALKHMNIVDFFVADYFHAGLEGVGKQFSKILDKHLTPNDIAIMDKIILEIRAPNQITRLSRPFSERAQWKAREWENWILYYSLPVLTFIFRNKHEDKLLHWSYLVNSLHILLGTEITIDELNEANKMLHRFVKYAQPIYEELGLKTMTYNMHQMLHLAESVFNWGPLWAHSTFAFESGNMQVLQAIKGSRGVIQQIGRYINLQYCLHMLERRVYPSASPLVKEYCDMHNVQKTYKLSNEGSTYFGKPALIGRELLEKFGLPKQHARAFLKMVKCGCLYSTGRKNNDRSCNYYGQMKDGRFIKIDLFVINEEKQEESTTCYFIETTAFSININAPIHKVQRVASDLDTVRTKDIKTVCVNVATNDINYISPLPNLYHY